jgi:hypothetical protein
MIEMITPINPIIMKATMYCNSMPNLITILFLGYGLYAKVHTVPQHHRTNRHPELSHDFLLVYIAFTGECEGIIAYSD